MCTSVKIKATSGEYFWGRTMDMSVPLFPDKSGYYVPCRITSLPSNVELDSQLTKWTSKYSAIGVGFEDSPVLFDGINEHGLAGDLQVLTECGWAELADIEKNNKTPLIGEELVCYMLTNYKSVAEVRENFNQFMLVNQPYVLGKTDFHFPVHFSFVDETGDSIVLEPQEDGSLVMFTHIGVMANSPRYDYHEVNVRNYIGINSTDKSDNKVFNDGVTIKPIENGTGYGMFGLPGDYTSPSRFIRSFFLSKSLSPFDKEGGMNALYSVFRSSIIPQGIEKNEKNPLVSDFTRYWSGYNIADRTLVVQTGKGLAFTTKVLDKDIKSITYDEIQLAL